MLYEQHTHIPDVSGVHEELEGVLRRASCRGQPRFLLPLELPHSLLAVRREPELGFEFSPVTTIVGNGWVGPSGCMGRGVVISATTRTTITTGGVGKWRKWRA